MKTLLLAVTAALAAGATWEKIGPEGVWTEMPKEGYALEGKVVSTSIHTCNTKYDTGYPGYCNGTMRLTTTLGARREIVVTSKVAISLDGKSPVTLDALPGKNVRVEFGMKDGLFVAKRVAATSPKAAAAP